MSSWTPVLYNESRAQQMDQHGNYIFFWHSKQSVWGWGGAETLLILFTLSSCSVRTGKVMYPSALGMCCTAVFICLQRSDWLIHLPKWPDVQWNPSSSNVFEYVSLIHDHVLFTKVLLRYTLHTHLYRRVRSTACCGWMKRPHSRSWTHKTGSSGWMVGLCRHCGMTLC